MSQWSKYKKYGFIFDMDGVIINTCALHEESWINISEIYGFPWNKNINFKKDVFGTCSVDSARILFKHYISDQDIETMCLKKDIIYYSLLKKHVLHIVVPGFYKFFSNTVKSGIPSVLATSSTEKETEFVLKSLGIYHHFKAVLNISKVTHPKPHPEIYIKACEVLELPPMDCIGFEDSISGMTALNASGVQCLAVGTTLSYERLISKGIKFSSYFPDFKEITVDYVLDILRSVPLKTYLKA